METKNTFDTLDIFVYLWKKRKPIIIVTALGAIISIVVSLKMPNYYKAQSVLFPTRYNKQLNQYTPSFYVGDEDDLEKLIQMLQSDFITNRIIEKYDLINHYDLSQDDQHVMTKLKKIYNSNITFKKTHYQAAIITVIDKDPRYCADIANDIAELLDSLTYNMQKQKAQEAYLTAIKVYEEQKKYIKSLEDSLDFYRQKGVLDYYEEVDRYSEAYAKGYANNTITPKAEKMFSEKFDLLKLYGEKVRYFTTLANQSYTYLAKFKADLIQTQENLKAVYTRRYIISKAEVPDKKAFPKRSIIVVFSTIAAFVFAIVMLLFLDFYKEFKKRISVK